MAAAVPKDLILHTGPDSRLGLLPGFRNGDALAQSQAVGLHHRGDGSGFQIFQRRRQVVKGLIGRGGDVILPHQILGKDLAALQNGGGPIGAEAGDTHPFQQVHTAQNQGVIGGHHGKVDGLLLRKVPDGL